MESSRSIQIADSMNDEESSVVITSVVQPKKWISALIVIVRGLTAIIVVLFTPPKFYLLSCTMDSGDEAMLECYGDENYDYSDSYCDEQCSISNGALCSLWQGRAPPILAGLLVTLIFEVILVLKYGNPFGIFHATFVNIYTCKARSLVVSWPIYLLVLLCLVLEAGLMMASYWLIDGMSDHCTTFDASFMGLVWVPVVMYEVSGYHCLFYLSEGKYIMALFSLLRFDFMLVYTYILLRGMIRPILKLFFYMCKVLSGILIPILELFVNFSLSDAITSPVAAPAAVAAAPDGASAEKYDVFLTHDWGADEFMRNNHSRVSRVNKLLKEKGLVTWFDEDRMEGDIRYKMTEGIEHSKVIVVFITQRYLGKVSGSDPRDNCNFEFWHAFDLVGVERMIPVVMEARMRDPTTWRGKGGAALRAKLYVDLSDDGDVFYENMEALHARIIKIIESPV